jgi:hypothetical protein
MLKKVLKSISPPICVDLFRLAFPLKVSESKSAEVNLIDKEVIDFWANTSLFALEVIQGHGPLNEMRLLSLGNRMSHLADYVAVFEKVYHSTLLKTMFPVSRNGSEAKLAVLKADFFELRPLDVDCVISQGSIHCLNDSRYGNEASKAGWQRPYQAALKLRQIIGDRSIPVVVSIAVHRTESWIDDNARLAHDKFVASFLSAGFSLREYFFDYYCYGMPQLPEYIEPQYRRSKELPTAVQAPSEYNYVIGNYYFVSS